MKGLTRFLGRILPFWREEKATGTIEFVVLVPLLVSLMCSSVETGVMMTRFVVLERALDQVVRTIRLGQAYTQDEFRTAVCTTAGILPACEESLVVEMQVINTSTWVLPSTNAPCYDREEEVRPATTFNTGDQNQMVLIRTCIIYDAFMPTIGIGETLANRGQGQFYIKAASAYVQEP